MNVVGTFRGLARTLAGVTCASVLIAGCSSSTSGNASQLGLKVTPSASASASASSFPSTGTSSLPSDLSSGLPSDLSSALASALGSQPASVGSGAAAGFCKAYIDGAGQTDFGSASRSDLSKFVAHWQKVVDAAPDSIKPDAKTVLNFIKDLESGTPNASDAGKIGTAIGNLTTFYASNCR